jgi:hypothetical protein
LFNSKPAVYRDRPRTLNELKAAITAYIKKISQADLHKMFVIEIKRVQICIDVHGHHFKHLFISAQQLSERRSAESVCE